MRTADRYLLKTAFFIFLLANILSLLIPVANPFLWMNAIALVLTLLVVLLIWLTIRRYAQDCGQSREEIKELLGAYIVDETRGKLSFHEYLERRAERSDGG